MDVDAPTSRLDHLAELATSPTHANPSTTSSSSSSSVLPTPASSVRAKTTSSPPSSSPPSSSSSSSSSTSTSTITASTAHPQPSSSAVGPSSSSTAMSSSSSSSASSPHHHHHSSSSQQQQHYQQQQQHHHYQEEGRPSSTSPSQHHHHHQQQQSSSSAPGSISSAGPASEHHQMRDREREHISSSRTHGYSQPQHPSQSHHYPHHSQQSHSHPSQHHHQQQPQHPHHYSQSQQQQQQMDSDASWKSPITPTTTRKFNRMAIHEVLDSNSNEGNSPPYKRKGSPEDSFPLDARRIPGSPGYRHGSPSPMSNSEEDEEDVRNFKKRRMVAMGSTGSGKHQSHTPHPLISGGSGGPPEVMDQVRSTLKLKQQQKAIIESRQNAHQSTQPGQAPSSAAPAAAQPATATNGSGQGTTTIPVVTETTPSGVKVFHGSASFAAMNRRPLASPKNPKNQKSLTIFAPSYSESSLAIHSAPLQPSQGHQIMHQNPRTSHPMNQKQTPFGQHNLAHQQPLYSPRTTGHNKKSSRIAARQGPQTSGMDYSSSGTLPAPILSSHTGPLPSPSMYPHPQTPFHTAPKQLLMETVSNLFDTVDSGRSLKYTLEEQIRKSAQLLQTLQSSGTMIESLVRGQFKELEKGVIERFENEMEHMSARIRQLEEHQGLTAPPRKEKSISTQSSSTHHHSNNSNAMATDSPSENFPSPPSGAGPSSRTGPASQNGTLPTPPLAKTQESSSMEVEEASGASSEGRAGGEYNNTVKDLQERIAYLERRYEKN